MRLAKQKINITVIVIVEPVYGSYPSLAADLNIVPGRIKGTINKVLKGIFYPGLCSGGGKPA